MSQTRQIVKSLFGRSLWVGVLFLLLSLISLVNPRLMPVPATATADGKEQVRRRLAWLRMSRARVSTVVGSARQQIGHSLGCVASAFDLPLPEADDIIVFSYGIPVVPYLKRVGVRQWNQWLDHLGETLRARYPQRADIAAGAAWEAWIRDHVHYVEVHFARLAGQRIARLAANLKTGPGKLYLFGHSAGGAAVLQYLADLRDEVVPAPAVPIRAALTMDAAVVGPSRVWTGWPVAPEHPGRLDRIMPKFRTYLKLNGAKPEWRTHFTWARDYMHAPFRGLGAWAREQEIAVLTVSNIADAFSHRILDDLPYLEMQIGTRFDIQGFISGKTHLCVQRDPRVPHFLWWHEDVYPKLELR